MRCRRLSPRLRLLSSPPPAAHTSRASRSWIFPLRVVLCLKEIRGFTRGLEHDVIERLYGNGELRTIGKSSQRVKQGVPHLIQIAQGRFRCRELTASVMDSFGYPRLSIGRHRNPWW